jgi:hypothetical protein
LEDFHVFGSPCYVLDDAIRDGISTGKWLEQSFVGVYVGLSPDHASNVALVYNPETKLVSPQFYVLIDESFSSVSSYANKNEVEKHIEFTLDTLFQKSLLPDQVFDHKSKYPFPNVVYFSDYRQQSVASNKKKRTVSLKSPEINTAGSQTLESSTPRASGNSSRNSMVSGSAESYCFDEKSHHPLREET